MTQISRNELKELFKTGAKPSGDDFKAFIDSTLNIKDDGIEKPSGANTPLKITAQGADENLLDFYSGETRTWSIDQKTGLNISYAGESQLFIENESGNIGLGTTNPGAKLEIDGDLKLEKGVTINNFSTDVTLQGNSDLTIPTEKAIKTYADTKALLAGSSNQDFNAKQLTVMNNLTVSTINPTTGTLKIEGKIHDGTGIIVPVGSILAFSGEEAPEGWFLCDGSSIDSSTFKDLFDVIGYKYGKSESGNQFSLPNLQGRCPIGINKNDSVFNTLGKNGGNKTHQLSVNQMPSHSHQVSDPDHSHGYTEERRSTPSVHLDYDKKQRGNHNTGTQKVEKSTTSSGTGISIQSTGGGGSFSLLQPYLTLNFIIKF